MVQERATDHDIWARLDVVTKRYKVIWGLWLILLPAVGWAARTYLEPIRAMPALQAQTTRIEVKQDSVIVPRLDKLDRAGEQRDQILKVFGKILCAMTTAEDRYKYDINCRTDIPAPVPPAKIPAGGT